MPLPKLPVTGLDDLNHRRRARETLNQVLDHSFDDSRRQTTAEKLVGVTPVNPAYPPGDVLRYGADKTGKQSSQGALQAAYSVAAQMASDGAPFEVSFQAGVYRYSTSPDWRLKGLTLRALGRVVLYCEAGAGSAWVIGNSANGTNITDTFMLGDFVIDGAGTCENGLFLENASHGIYQAKVKNVTDIAFVINGCVESRTHLICSVNAEPDSTNPVTGAVTSVVMPAEGIEINGSSIVSNTTDCLFDLRLEGIDGDGITANNCDSCRFVGTSEGNTARGALLTSGSFNNNFLDFFMEGNGNFDIDDSGIGNTYENCVASTQPHSIKFQSGTKMARWMGGRFYELEFASGSKDCQALFFNNLSSSTPCTIVDNSGNFTNWVYGGQLALSSDPVPAKLRIREEYSNLTPAGTWVNTSSTYDLLGYSMNYSTREVHIKGEVGGGTAGTTITTLPSGRRPAKQYTFVCASTTTQNYATVSVATNGVVAHIAGYTTSIDLASIRFPLS